MTSIYLDHNAATPLLPEAWEAMRPFVAEAFANPSSAHHAGRKARRAIEDARERIAALVGAHPDEVVFTSGATEANNLAILGVDAGTGGHILASHLEHPCVVEPVRQLERRGAAVEWLRPSTRGILLAETIREAIRPDTRLVCVMLANHETGAIQPAKQIAAALPHGVAVHCDAAQAVGKIPIAFRDLGVATLTASAHKFGGPKGIGILLVRRGMTLAPLAHGGHQQQGRRPGTEPVALAVGMAAALEAMTRNMAEHREKLIRLRERLWRRLSEASGSSIVLNGPAIGDSDVVPATLNVSFPGCRADVLLMALDLAGVACSTGSACSSGSLLPSPVLAAMGVPDDVLRSALRFSFGPASTMSEIDDAASRILEATALRRVGPSRGTIP